MYRPYRLILAAFVVAALTIAGCDSGVAPDEVRDDQTTVQFASSGAAVTEDDSTATVTVQLRNPDGNAVSVEVLFAAGASTADLGDLNLSPDDLEGIGDAYVVETVSFPAGAADGATQSITFDVTDDELEDRETAVFALQNLQTGGTATLADPREFGLEIGFPSLRDVREEKSLGDDVTVQATVARIDRSTAFLQDETGGIAVFDSDFAGGVTVGDFVVVNGELDVFAGLLQIVGVGSTFTVFDQGREPAVQTATLAEIADDGEQFESTLTRVENLTFEDAGGRFQGGENYVVGDGSGGAVELRVPEQSYYAGRTIPSEPVMFTGVVGQFNGNFDSIEPNTGYQLLAVQEGDLSGVADGGPPQVSINEARTEAFGTQVVIEATVTRAFGAFARIQDASGPTGASALVIRQTGGDQATAFQEAISDGTIQPGTVLRVTGTTSAFNGLVRISDGDLTDFEVVSQGSVPSPQVVALDDLQASGEDYESELVRVEGLTFSSASGSFENDTSYDVEDGDGTTFTLHVQGDDETELGGTPIPGEAFTYEGVIDQLDPDEPRDSGYRLIPVRTGDLVTQ